MARAEKAVLDLVFLFPVLSLEPDSASGIIFTRLEVAETLVEVDRRGRPIPGLAETWTRSADSLTWRFVPRAGVRFHDGTPLTLQTVVDALALARSKTGLLAEAPIESITAEEGAVVIRLTSAFSLLPAALAAASTQILAPASYGEDGRVRAVIGTGPYRVTGMDLPNQVETERFKDYWGKRPAIGKVRYRAVEDAAERFKLAEAGAADMVFTLSASALRWLKGGDGLVLHSVPVPRTVVLKLNAAHPLLRDPEIRRAISLCIDRVGLAYGFLSDPRAAAHQLFPPTLSGWYQADMPPLEHDPRAARAILGDKGWRAKPNGMLVRDGQPFALTLVTFPDRPELPAIARSLKDQFRVAGIDVTVSVETPEAIEAGHKDGTLEMALFARNYFLVPDPLGILLQDFGAGGGVWGAMNWGAPEVDAILSALVEAGPGEPVAEERARLARLLGEDLPVIPVTWYQHTAAVSRDLGGVILDPFERTFGISDMRWVR